MIAIRVHDEAIQRLSRNMAAYVEVSRKTLPEVLAKKAEDVAFQLYRQFSKVAPERGQSWAEGKARGWRMGNAQISPRAWELARSLAGSAKSVYGYVTGEGSAARIHTMRVGKRGKRIIGGRRGTGGRAGTAADLASGLKLITGEHSIPVRALAIYFEHKLRESGRKSLAVSWLHKRNRINSSLKRSHGQSTRLEIVNPKSEVKVLGWAQGGGSDDKFAVELASRLPGVSRFPHAVNSAIQATNADTEVYLRRKLGDAFMETLHRA